MYEELADQLTQMIIALAIGGAVLLAIYCLWVPSEKSRNRKQSPLQEKEKSDEA